MKIIPVSQAVQAAKKYVTNYREGVEFEAESKATLYGDHYVVSVTEKGSNCTRMIQIDAYTGKPCPERIYR